MSDRHIGRTTDANGKVCDLYEPTDREVEVFCDGIQGLQARGPNIKFNLYRTIPELFDESRDGAERRVVATRIVMSVDSFIAVSDWLSARADEIRSQVEIVPAEDSKH